MVHSGRLRWAAVLITACLAALTIPVATVSAQGPLLLTAPEEGPRLPAEGDYTAASLRAWQQAMVDRHGGTEPMMPLSIKAELLEQVLRKYHFSPDNQAITRVTLPEQPGELPEYHFCADESTWNGALLSALSLKYAVTRDPRTLEFIGRVLRGLHFYQEVTGKYGLVARCVLKRDTPLAEADRAWTAPDGTVYHYYADPAKGTYNLIVGGYATMMMFAYADLPEDLQKLARNDLQALAYHVVYHDYRLTARDGDPTSYGNLTPIVGSQSIPFNAQVAYQIVAAGHYFPGDIPKYQDRIDDEFKRLREKHHVYYERPGPHWILPQRVGNSPFVKGMNDRNHVLLAAHTSLMMEKFAAVREQRALDRRFVYQMGRTMYWTMQKIESYHNAVCNFAWAGILQDPLMFATLVPREADRTRWQMWAITLTGTEQLRRCPFDRFYEPGRKIVTSTPQFLDVRRNHDTYYWKGGPFDRWEVTGEPTDTHTASIDFLHAYWMMRYYNLDHQPPQR